MREAEQFCSELNARNFHLGALVLNKTLPEYLRSVDGEHAADVLERDRTAIAAELAALDDPALGDPADTARVLTTVAESFRNYQVVAKREAELRDELSRLPDVVATVPTFDTDITDIAGLARIGEHLFQVGEGPAGAAGTLAR